jgi:hypothetical protein
MPRKHKESKLYKFCPPGETNSLLCSLLIGMVSVEPWKQQQSHVNLLSEICRVFGPKLAWKVWIKSWCSTFPSKNGVKGSMTFRQMGSYYTVTICCLYLLFGIFYLGQISLSSHSAKALVSQIQILWKQECPSNR